MAESNGSPVDSGSVRKRIRDAQEAALSAAFEEVHRLLDRIDEIKISLPQAGAGSLAQISDAVKQANAAIGRLVESAKQDIQATAQRERLGITECVREGAKAAGIDGAVQGYLGIEKKAIAQINEAVTALDKKLEAMQTAADALSDVASRTAEKRTSGVSLLGLLASLSAFTVLMLGGVWMMQKTTTADPAVAFYKSLTPEQQTQVWHVLPHEAQVRINQAYQQAKQ